MVDFLVKYWFYMLVIICDSYLIGSINSSIIVTKLLKTGKDIREVGSGNAGFTNTLRTMGKKAAALTFIGDFLKGVLAVFIAIKISSFVFSGDEYSAGFRIFCYIASFMCVIGHMYPCFFGFKGGKGILTAWASTLLIDYRIFLVLISVFLVVLLLTKIISISSICAAVSYPFATTFIHLFACERNEFIFLVTISSVLSVLVIFKHKSNIIRILKGEEKRLSESKVSK